MFSVEFRIAIRLADCPEGGIAAVDWRREHGLPEAPTSEVQLRWEGTSEPLCRRYPQLCGESADLSVTTSGSGYSSSELGEYRAKEHVSPDGRTLSSARVTDALVRPFLCGEATPNDVAAVIDSLIAQATTAKAIAEQERIRRDQEKAEREARSQREYNEREAEKAREAAAAKAEQDAWVGLHGSERLRNCLAEGIECSAAYRDERLEVERPDWLWYPEVPGQYGDPRNPPAEAFDLLAEARKSDPTARLKHYEIEREEEYEDEGSKFAWTGYVAVADFLGRQIVYGIPEAQL